jgi:hypothetical protein
MKRAIVPPQRVGSTVVLVAKQPRPVHPYFTAGFMLLSVAGLDELDLRMADRSIGMQAMRVLVAMARSCDYENRVRAGQKDLAAHLDMDQSDVSKAIRALIACGLIEPPEHSRGPYRISPRLLWKGSARTLKKALDERAAA